MATEVGPDGAAALQQPTAPTSLRLLRLQNGFRSMLRTGMERLDEQSFLARFRGQAEERHLQLMWQLLLRQREAIAAAAEEEMASVCAEVGLQQQLEELEAVVLERGLLAASSSGAAPLEPAALPSAAEAAARVAAKQAEKQQLVAELQELRAQQDATATQLAAKRESAAELLRDFDASVCDQVDKVYKAAAQWLHASGEGPDSSDAPVL